MSENSVKYVILGAFGLAIMCFKLDRVQKKVLQIRLQLEDLNWTVTSKFREIEEQRERETKNSTRAVPYITWGMWKGKWSLREAGGYSWFSQHYPRFSGSSDLKNDFYSAEFLKMDGYLSGLNRSNDARKLVTANIANLGESCRKHGKLLTLAYECRKFNLRTQSYGESLQFPDGSDTRTIEINENNSEYIHCFDARERMNDK